MVSGKINFFYFKIRYFHLSFCIYLQSPCARTNIACNVKIGFGRNYKNKKIK